MIIDIIYYTVRFFLKEIEALICNIRATFYLKIGSCIHAVDLYQVYNGSIHNDVIIKKLLRAKSNRFNSDRLKIAGKKKIKKYAINNHRSKVRSILFIF